MGGLLSLLVVAYCVLLERKILGGIQLRTGPIRVGYLGSLQTLVDRIKLLTKRVLRGKVMYFGRMFVITGVLVNWNIGVGFLLVGLSVLSYIFLGGVIYSECIYSKIGGLRSIISMLSYEVLLLMVLLFIVNI